MCYNYQKGKYPAEELPGVSTFYQDQNGTIFHTYSTYSRGVDMVMGAYHFLDLVSKGRDEDHLAWNQAWLRHHDKYEDSPDASSCCHGRVE